MHVQGSSQRHVAAISHWGHHQPGLCPQILIAIREGGVDLHATSNCSCQTSRFTILQMNSRQAKCRPW